MQSIFIIAIIIALLLAIFWENIKNRLQQKPAKIKKVVKKNPYSKKDGTATEFNEKINKPRYTGGNYED